MLSRAAGEHVEYGIHVPSITSPRSISIMTTKHKKCRRYNDIGHAHALTFSCFQRRPFLCKDRSRQWLVDSIDIAREKHNMHIWAYVIMPEHVHLLVWPAQRDYHISDFLQSFKTSVTRKATSWIEKNAPQFLSQMLDQQPNGQRHYRFWQRGGGYDRNIDEESTLWLEIDYFHLNPVRRKLCERIQDWHWSSALDYLEIGTGPLRLDLEMLPARPDGLLE